MEELYIHRGIENVSQGAADKCPLRLGFFVVNFGYKLLHSVRGDAAVFGGGIADIGFENAAEVGGGLKAEPRADFLNTQITVVKQHQHGKVNRFFVFVVNRSHAE